MCRIIRSGDSAHLKDPLGSMCTQLFHEFNIACDTSSTRFKCCPNGNVGSSGGQRVFMLAGFVFGVNHFQCGHRSLIFRVDPASKDHWLGLLAARLPGRLQCLSC